MKKTRHIKRNFILLVLNWTFWRIGWIFKTESVIMPGFLLSLTSSGTIRGFLPLASRLGGSIPQFFVAHWIRGKSRKKWIFMNTALLAALPWTLLAFLLKIAPDRNILLIVGFILFYLISWISTGCIKLLSGTVQGKLIPATSRGKLAGIAGFLGCTMSALVAYILMPVWLSKKSSQAFIPLFGMTAIFFVLAALVIAFLKEPEEHITTTNSRFIDFITDSSSLFKRDRNFRRLIFAVCLLQMNSIIFPHYTAFGKEALGIVPTSYVLFVIVQNLANALNSLFMGNIADKKGNRLVLEILIGITGLVPLIAIGITRLPRETGIKFFWIIYFFIGMLPITQRIIINYALELSPIDLHPQYLGTLNLFRILPLLLSPVVGLFIDVFSYELVFTSCSILIFLGIWITSTIDEPRHWKRSDESIL